MGHDAMSQWTVGDQENRMNDERANEFLWLIRRSQRGKLKVYLGFCAGVGKTYQMLQEGHRLKAEGVDVVIGLLETHDRAEIATLASGLEMIPRRRLEYHGVVIDEMDLDAVLSRKPQVALIDELAHTNVPGSRNPKRFQDVQDILASGIHVISTLNVQHLESLYHVVEKAVGIKVKERLPDAVLAEADQIVNVDLTAEDLRKRMEEGKIYPLDRVSTALANFFSAANLENLRELTLRELASQIDLRRRETSEEESLAMPDQVMVGLSSRGPNSEVLLRYASRLAGKLNRNWYAVYVQTPAEEATVIDALTQRLIADTLTLAKQLGAMVFTFKGEDVADTLLRFAREYRVGHIIIGKPRKTTFWRKFGKNKNIIHALIAGAQGIAISVLDAHKEESLVISPPLKRGVTDPLPAIETGRLVAGATSVVPAESKSPYRLGTLLAPEAIVIWDRPVEKQTVLRVLAETLSQNREAAETESLLAAVLRREEQGTTFFNEGVAFPHVRMAGLLSPRIAIGLIRQGIADVSTQNPIELVFLILSPLENPDVQVQVLALASRAAQNRHLVRNLKSARTPPEALEVIANWEMSNARPTGGSIEI